MAKKSVNDPGSLGWTDDGNGFWSWSGDGDGSDCAGMVVSATEPTDPIEGMQWLNSDTAEVFIFDGAVWLEFPAGSGGSGGPDASSGGLWEQDGSDIYYDKGNVSVSGSFTAGGSVMFNGKDGLTSDPNNNILGVTSGGAIEDGVVSLGRDNSGGGEARRFKDGYFSGTVNATETQVNKSIVISRSNDTEASFQLRGASDKVTAIGIYGSGTGTTRFQYNKDFELGKSNDYSLSRFTPHLSIAVATGDAQFSGSVDAREINRNGYSGIHFTTNYLLPMDSTGAFSTGKVDLGHPSYKFKAGYFSGSVTAGQVVLETATYLNGSGAVIKNSTGGSGVIITNNGSQFDPIVDAQMNLGDPQRRWNGGYFSGTVTTNTLVTNRANNGYFFRAEYGSTGESSSFNHSGGNQLEIIPLGGLFKVNGTVSDESGPLMSKRGLISTLSTLRNATMDETQDIRESLRSAIDELVEGFEQEIATMPAGDSE